jgi:hypothetical protein
VLIIASMWNADPQMQGRLPVPIRQVSDPVPNRRSFIGQRRWRCIPVQVGVVLRARGLGRRPRIGTFAEYLRKQFDTWQKEILKG